MKKRYLVTFSGGKDSLATIIWAMLTLPFDDWDVVFCDTGWEADETYAYIDWIEKQIGKKFIRLTTTHFDAALPAEMIAKVIEIFGRRNVFAEMVLAKKRFPSTKARFCTEFLKMKVMIDYILSLAYDVIVVQGVRSEESEARKNLKKDDEYFKFYFEPYRKDSKGKNVYHTYLKEQVVAWLDQYSCDVIRPILDWKVKQVFDYIFDNGFKPNPLYLMGHSRVGCYPCIMCRLAEIKLISENDPVRIKQLIAFEKLSGSTFFPMEYIPMKYCTKEVICEVYPKDLVRLYGKVKKQKHGTPAMFPGEIEGGGDLQSRLYQKFFKSPAIEVYVDDDGDEYILRKVKAPTIEDVVRYVADNPDQSRLYGATGPSCVSVYNICEVDQ